MTTPATDVAAMPAHERRILLVSSSKFRTRELLKQIVLFPVMGSPRFIADMIRRLFEEDGVSSVEVDVDDIRRNFEFPLGHPIGGVAYACADVEDDHYFPVSTFHRSVFERKHTAFLELCQHLGAKRVSLVTGDSSRSESDASLDLDGVPTDVGEFSASGKLKSGRGSKSNLKADVVFGRPGRLVREFDSPWIDTEPTWAWMKRRREDLANGEFESCRVSISHHDDCGVSFELAAKIEKAGFKAMISDREEFGRELQFDVEFWPSE